MGYRHSADEILDAAVRTATRSGLRGLSFRLVAQEAGTSDRMVVYYFPDKARLVSAVLGRVGDELRMLLGSDVAHPEPHAPIRQRLLEAARRVFTDPANAWVVRLLVETLGSAVAGEEPYASIGTRILDEWIVWIDELLGEQSARGIAADTVASIDGLLLLGALLGPEAASAGWDAAIARAGLEPPRG